MANLVCNTIIILLFNIALAKLVIRAIFKLDLSEWLRTWSTIQCAYRRTLAEPTSASSFKIKKSSPVRKLMKVY